MIWIVYGSSHQSEFNRQAYLVVHTTYDHISLFAAMLEPGVGAFSSSLFFLEIKYFEQ